MAQRTDAQLTTEKDIIKDETVVGANSATRIGTMFEDINDSKINNDKIDTDASLNTAGKTVPGRDALKTYIANVLAGLNALTSDDIDTLAEINAILTDADLVSQSTYTAGLATKGDALITPNSVTGAHTLDASDLAILNAGGQLLTQGNNTGALTFPDNATLAIPVGASGEASGFTGIIVAGGSMTLTFTNGSSFPSGESIFWTKTGTNSILVNNGIPDASSSTRGLAKLYTSTGTNVDGPMDQNSTKTALDLKAPLASPTFTGTPAAPTAAGGTNSTQIATTAFVKSALDALIASAPGALDTLDELAAALGDDANFASTVTTALGLRELLSNKATGFGTLNNTLYPTVQAVATYVATLTGGGYSDVAFVNNYSGVDPTGVADSKTGLQAAMASGKKIIVFDGLYKTTDLLTLNTGQTVLLRGGTVVTLSGNVNTGNCLFLMADKSHILAESGARLTHVPTGTASYSGIRASSKYLWSIDGKLTIDGFGNQGIWIQGAGSGNNGFKNGFIRGVICQSNINNGFGGANGAGHGIRFDAGTEYVYIIDCELYENQGFGVLNLGGANNPIINTKVIKNTLGGLRIIGHYTNNTDHFQVVGCQINHNDAVGTYNIWVSDVDTGVNFTGLSVYGGTLIKAENSVGISFNGCGLSISGNSYVSPGTDGDGIVAINGGHVIGSGTSIEGFKTNLVGGGQVIFSNVRECQLTASYSSDFSAGVNSWSDNGTTATGNIDSITDGTTSFSDTLRIAGDGNNSTHFISRATTLTIGNKYKIVVTLYILTANTNVDGIRLTDSGGLSLDFDYLRTGKWITVEKDFTALGTTLQLSLLDGAVDSFTAPVGDLVYIGRVKVFQR
jgi:hypothetical protein